jgi:hypothetical protein
MRKMGQTRKFDVLMHLGDVYYSGTKKEVEDRFLKIWPTEVGTLNRALNGNHEMYSGGFGYFQLMLPPFQQASSYFALHNDNWVLIGLDTAYVDHDMDTTQVAWLNVVLSELEAKKKRKVVLFSHHQPFSRLDHKGQGPKLQKALAHLFDDQVITAWYFGHEHQCIIYDQHPEWLFHARCLGHGGIPEARKSSVKEAPADPKNPGGAGCTWRRLEANTDAPGCIALDGPNMDMKKKSDQDKFSPHGFMTLEFKGDSLIERVVSSDNTVIFTNTIK